MILKENDVLLMIGDSITDCGRGRISADGIEPSLGNGYVGILGTTLQRRFPELKIQVINKGISGNTTRDLKKRWQKDVLDIAPNWLCIMIGINDVWRSFDRPDNPEFGVSLEEYEANLEELIIAAKPVVKSGIVLATPYFIEPNREDKMRATMDLFSAAVKRLSAKHNLLIADSQAPFDKVLETQYPMYFCSDRVHPNEKGHRLLAGMLLNLFEEK